MQIDEYSSRSSECYYYVIYIYATFAGCWLRAGWVVTAEGRPVPRLSPRGRHPRSNYQAHLTATQLRQAFRCRRHADDVGRLSASYVRRQRDQRQLFLLLILLVLLQRLGSRLRVSSCATARRSGSRGTCSPCHSMEGPSLPSPSSYRRTADQVMGVRRSLQLLVDSIAIFSVRRHVHTARVSGPHKPFPCSCSRSRFGRPCCSCCHLNMFGLEHEG